MKRFRRTLLPTFASLLLASTTGCWTKQAQWEQSSDADRLTRKQGETEAEALYRAGVRCMDDFERPDCALEYFEKLVARNPNEPALVSDALFRLHGLYIDEGRDEEATLLLRKYWDAGNEKGSSKNLHYPARWLPTDFSVMYTVDHSKYRKSRLSEILSADARDTIFTCDEVRRKELEERAEARRKKKREERRARLEAEGKELPPEDDRESRYESQATADTSGDDADGAQAVYEDGRCALARALGTIDTSEWTRTTSAINVRDDNRSAAIYSISRIEKRIAGAVAAGDLIPLEDGTWQLPGLTHAKDQRVRVAIVDLDTVVLAGDEVMDEFLAHKAANEVTLAPALQQLTKRVPDEVTFFTVMAPIALKAGMSQAGALAAFLPEPEGMMMAAVAYDYVGLFVRMPTSDPVKAAALVSIVKWGLERAESEAEQSPEDSAAASALSDMDVAQSPDGSALLMSTVLPPEAIESMLME
jgi:hypothetical protein